MPINRVQVIWTGTPVVGGGLSTFYFNSAVGTAAQQVSAVQTFLAATEDRRSTTLSWATAADVATLDIATGALTGITTTTPATGVGTAAGDIMPPSNQGLLRLLSSQIAGGRLIRGRLFLPGSIEGDNVSTGLPSNTYTADYNVAAAALIADANSEWRIWSPTHGVAPDVVTAVCWNKWAILRSRRD